LNTECKGTRNTRDDGRHADAAIIVPPPSPSETNPPLGPAILARTAAEHGIYLDVIDLNIAYISNFEQTSPARHPHALGDHGKDRGLLAEAAERFFSDTGLRAEAPFHLPDTGDAAAGMHFGFDALSRAGRLATMDESPWHEWLEAHLFRRWVEPPSVLGISLMGPSQVFLTLVILAIAKRRWPQTLTVLGGSHVTLLAREIAADRRYRDNVDVVLPGHSENEFVRLLLDQRIHSDDQGSQSLSVPHDNGSFSYFPLFEPHHLRMYDQENLTLPLQFTRGCAYGRCTFCTYPVVEPQLTTFEADRAQDAIRNLLNIHGVSRFSIKDSLFTIPMMLGLAEALIDSGPPIRWSATTKASRSLVHHAPKLAESGLTTLEIGVETIHRAGQTLFDKPADPGMIEDVLLSCAESGITMVVNLIFGLPGETIEDAEKQLRWFLELRSKARPGRIEGSLNTLEIVRGSPLERHPPADVELYGVAPWAYCYSWNSPPWRRQFVSELRRAEMLI
jgi:hypothetical protein